MFNVFPLKVAAPLVPVVVNVAILFEYAVFQFVSSVVVGITYPLVKLNTPVELVYVNPVADELKEVSVIKLLTILPNVPVLSAVTIRVPVPESLGKVVCVASSWNTMFPCPSDSITLFDKLLVNPLICEPIMVL